MDGPWPVRRPCQSNWLIVFEGQEVIAAGAQHGLARRFDMGGLTVQEDEPASQIRVFEDPLSDWDSVGLDLHASAGQILQAGYADRRELALTAAVVCGRLAIIERSCYEISARQVVFRMAI